GIEGRVRIQRSRVHEVLGPHGDSVPRPEIGGQTEIRIGVLDGVHELVHDGGPESVRAGDKGWRYFDERRRRLTGVDGVQPNSHRARAAAEARLHDVDI